MTQRPSPQHQAMTIERLERALQAAAYIVVRHGEHYGSLLEWLDEELQERRRVPSARDRAQQILRASLGREVAHAL